ncbi:MAG: hypothetical protein R3237_02780, partial [Nitrosopumilaceae archaeon]|nr:hypothetical protein [Nitrosopumilaceae archaeon]
MSENNQGQGDPIPTNEFLIEEVAKIKAELEELKNLKDETYTPSATKRKTAAKRKPARKTAAKRKPARKKGARTTTTGRECDKGNNSLEAGAKRKRGGGG